MKISNHIILTLSRVVTTIPIGAKDQCQSFKTLEYGSMATKSSTCQHCPLLTATEILLHFHKICIEQQLAAFKEDPKVAKLLEACVGMKCYVHPRQFCIVSTYQSHCISWYYSVVITETEEHQKVYDCLHLRVSQLFLSIQYGLGKSMVYWSIM